MRTKIKFPIGDWSDDGHGRCDWYMASTTMTVEDVREAHFACKNKFGFDIGEICSQYGETTIDSDLAKKISAVVPLGDYAYGAEGSGEYTFEYNTEAVFALWIAILNKSNLDLDLVTEEVAIEAIQFSGHDSLGRHIVVPGYGVFGEA